VCCTASALCIAPGDVAAPAPSPGAEAEKKKGLLREVLGNKPFLTFLLLTLAFYFSNGAMLPLVAQAHLRQQKAASSLVVWA
jgi:hypothetical protein